MSRAVLKFSLAAAGCAAAIIVGPGALAAWSASSGAPAALTPTASVQPGDLRHSPNPWPTRTRTKTPSKSPSKSPSMSPSRSQSTSASPTRTTASPSSSTLPVTGGTSSGTLGGLVLGGVAAIGLGTAMYRNGRRRAAQQ
ncbi:MAG TPA: hypothetical protein VL738_11890 [Dactylosporangium sp.]|nr:hypothetical protein [Dactylosporangium sp.]